MRVLVCNLDPEWDFISWTWRHGVDLYGDADLTLWDISGRSAFPALHWPDVLSADNLAGRLREYREGDEPPPELVILLGGLAAPLDPARLESMSTAWGEGGQCILLSTERYWNQVAGEAVDVGRFEAIVLSRHQTSLEHYYLFRLLLEVLRSPQKSSVFASRSTLLEAEIFWSDAGKQSDSVVQEWPGYVTELLTYYESVLRSDAGAEGAREFEVAVDEYLGEVAALLDRLPPETPEAGEDATLPDIDAPLFNRPTLLATIDRACQGFYDSLRQMLYAWYARLQGEQDNLVEVIQREGQEALSHLEVQATSIRQALNREAVRKFKDTRKVLADDWMSRVHSRLDDDLAVMQGGKVPRTSWLHPQHAKPPMLASFVMPWFPEDERLDSSRNTVRQSARALAGRSWFWSAPVVLALLVALPVTTRVLAKGSPLGWLDGAWVATFMLLMLGSQLLYAVLRNRHLRRHMYAMRNAAGGARARHLLAVQASYRYLYAREAMRRLARLDQLCRHYLAELQIDIDEVTRHQAFLKTLADYFSRAGVARKPAMARGEWGADGRPRAWLATILKDYVKRERRASTGELWIRASHVSGPDERFVSRYLDGADTLVIRPVRGAP